MAGPGSHRRAFGPLAPGTAVLALGLGARSRAAIRLHATGKPLLLFGLTGLGFRAITTPLFTTGLGLRPAPTRLVLRSALVEAYGFQAGQLTVAIRIACGNDGLHGTRGYFLPPTGCKRLSLGTLSSLVMVAGSPPSVEICAFSPHSASIPGWAGVVKGWLGLQAAAACWARKSRRCRPRRTRRTGACRARPGTPTS